MVQPDRSQMAIIIRGIRYECWIPKATNPHSEFGIVFFPRSNNGYANAPQCYVTFTLSVLLYVNTLTANYYYIKVMFNFVPSKLKGKGRSIGAFRH
jgi:hypothetical protein